LIEAAHATWDLLSPAFATVRATWVGDDELAAVLADAEFALRRPRRLRLGRVVMSIGDLVAEATANTSDALRRTLSLCFFLEATPLVSVTVEMHVPGPKPKDHLVRAAVLRFAEPFDEVRLETAAAVDPDWLLRSLLEALASEASRRGVKLEATR
jgi:hypothetical protein